MFSSAMTGSQSMYISVVMLIIGIMLLRACMSMRKSRQKPNLYELARQHHAEQQETGHVVGGITDALPSAYFAHKPKDSPEPVERSHVPDYGFGTVCQPAIEQQEAELLTLSRQIKAEIDTKIVALQLMIADADNVLQEFRRHIPHGERMSLDSQLSMLSRSPVEPDRIRSRYSDQQLLKPDETLTDPPQSMSPPGDLQNLVVEDPFAESNFGFDKAMRDLHHLSSSIPTFDAASLPDAQPNDAAPSALPEWDTPLSYPISGYRNPTSNPMSRTHVLPSEIASIGKTSISPNSSTNTSLRRKSTYTNKLLTQAPPQLDALMTDEPVRKMGSKPRSPAGQEPTASSYHDEPLAPPSIPKITPPSAHDFLAESIPFSQTEPRLDKIAVRRAKRHQLQYLIDKGMSPKEIAAHLEMPLGEVELIFSLHREQGSGNRDQRSATSPPRIIAAEDVVM